MDIIRDIVKARSMCCIVLDRGDRYWLRTADLLDAGYTPGQEISVEELEHFVLLHQYPRALNEAVAMLARRPCSQGEIRQKLVSHHYMNETVEMVLYKLTREHLLNDADFSEQWVRSRSGQKFGKYRIFQELRKKGISEEDAKSALEQMDEDEILTHAKELAAKALRSQKKADDPKKQAQRIIQKLIRRGYTWETARDAFNMALQETEENG